MKLLLLITAVAALHNCSSKKATANDTAATEQRNGADTIPACIVKMIDNFKAEERQNPPRSVYQYTYKGRTVYYVPPICCDFFSDLYDSNCNIIAHPDGGFTGKGDGKEPEFGKMRTDEKLLWEDKRKAGG